LEIFYKLSLSPQVFVPPAWKLNENSIEVLKKVGFDLTEMQERLLLLSHNTCKKKFSKFLTGIQQVILKKYHKYR
jgi:predicted deacetylase